MVFLFNEENRVLIGIILEGCYFSTILWPIAGLTVSGATQTVIQHARKACSEGFEAGMNSPGNGFMPCSLKNSAAINAGFAGNKDDARHWKREIGLWRAL